MSNIREHEKKKINIVHALYELLYRYNRCPNCGNKLSVKNSNKSNRYIYCDSCDLEEHNLIKFVKEYRKLYFKEKIKRKKSAKI